VVVDYNRIQSLGRTEDVLNLDPLAAKWASFGWEAIEVDGHSVDALLATLSTAEIFLRLIPLLSVRGVVTLADAKAFCDKMLLLRWQTSRF
jgi:transketolase